MSLSWPCSRCARIGKVKARDSFGRRWLIYAGDTIPRTTRARHSWVTEMSWRLHRMSSPPSWYLHPAGEGSREYDGNPNLSWATRKPAPKKNVGPKPSSNSEVKVPMTSHQKRANCSPLTHRDPTLLSLSGGVSVEWARHAAVRKGQVIVELCASLGFSLVIFSTGKREARGPPPRSSSFRGADLGAGRQG